MEISNTFNLVSIFAKASLVTIEVAFLSIIIAFVIGMICRARRRARARRACCP